LSEDVRKSRGTSEDRSTTVTHALLAGFRGSVQ